MRVYPFILDSRPPYLSPGGETASVLLAPLGDSHVVRRVLAAIKPHASGRPTVLADFEPSVAYAHALRDTVGSDIDVGPMRSLVERLRRLPPGDHLLIVDPHCLPDGPLDLSPLFEQHEDVRWAHHIVALESTPAGTKEAVELDSEGHVQRIQRYFEEINWPVTSGVVASLLPVASAALAETSSLRSLWDLRGILTGRGIPSRDIPLRRATYYLGAEIGLLAINERLLLDALFDAGPGCTMIHRGPRCQIHRTARLVGPLILHEGVTIDEYAEVIGPAVVGAGCRISSDAIVAQSVVLRGVEVGPGVTVRHRVHAAARPEERVFQPPVTRHFAHSPAAPMLRPDDASIDAPERPFLVAKRFVEGAIAGASLLALSPVLALVALLVKLDSPGPAFYGDSREGRNGRAFRCWKFRTMVPDADARQRELAESNQVDGPQFKITSDPRITRLGRLLRKTNIDELPQLFNVLVGQMSLVGPRPSPFRENQTCVPWREGRLSVRPGITGLWQVCRFDRDQGDFHQWIHFDLLYVKHMSPLLDLKILFYTITTLGGRRSVPVERLIPRAKSQDENSAVPVEVA
jgi:lipopolysaccharide/colanic/teichoic acid biosynthesis glycosyltransferase